MTNCSHFHGINLQWHARNATRVKYQNAASIATLFRSRTTVASITNKHVTKVSDSVTSRTVSLHRLRKGREGVATESVARVFALFGLEIGQILPRLDRWGRIPPFSRSNWIFISAEREPAGKKCRIILKAVEKCHTSRSLGVYDEFHLLSLFSSLLALLESLDSRYLLPER